jgi:integrase/recombinase XerD
MRLHRTATAYIALRRRMGYRLAQDGKRLLEYVEFLRRMGEAQITVENALAWAQGAVSTRSAARRLSMVRGFAQFRQLTDARTEVPARDLLPDRSRRTTPYIYSDDDLRSLLRAARTLHGTLRPATYSTLFGLLAATGMRVGEATALDRDDFDAQAGVLRVVQGKEGSLRRLPLHVTTADALRTYARRRDRVLRHPRGSTFFLSEAGTALLRQNVHETFLRLIDRAGMADRKPRRPRIHDLRHSFAVHTMTDWYRAGRDVEKILPHLSAYLGHASPASTYWYLTGTPELLSGPAERLERQMRRST